MLVSLELRGGTAYLYLLVGMVLAITLLGLDISQNKKVMENRRSVSHIHLIGMPQTDRDVDAVWGGYTGSQSALPPLTRPSSGRP
jgi:hypothetical protein